MRKTYWLILVLLVFTTAVYLLAFEWIVPRTAAFTIPAKWRMIPLRQSKDIVHNYFGDPLPGHPASNDEWANGSKGKMYVLKVYYVGDTIASAYSIHYKFKNAVFSKEYLIDSSSIR